MTSLSLYLDVSLLMQYFLQSRFVSNSKTAKIKTSLGFDHQPQRNDQYKISRCQQSHRYLFEFEHDIMGSLGITTEFENSRISVLHLLMT